MLPKVLTITLNPSIDVTLWLDQLDADAINRVRGEARQPGGKGINLSRVLHRAGIQTMATGLVGFENYQMLTSVLGREGTKHRFVQSIGDIRENITLRVGPRTIKINRPGAECTPDQQHKLLRILKEELNAGDIFVLAGSLPPGVTAGFLEAMAVIGRERGCPFVIDCESIALDQLLQLAPALIKPNLYEFCKLIGCEMCPPAALVTLARERLVSHGVSTVLISMGGAGVLGVTSEDAVLVTVPEVEVKSTVGAGDSTLAGFLAARIRGLPFDECVRLSAAFGTASVTAEATDLASPAKAAELYGQISAAEL